MKSVHRGVMYCLELCQRGRLTQDTDPASHQPNGDTGDRRPLPL